MTVLIVDDQLSIVSGMISGIDWQAVGITNIQTASSARKAKEILKSAPVDLLLCDIEMPAENGLSLLRWVRDRGMTLACIFLTAHADFLYAREAITLGSVDYILQPARYEDIQTAIAKALKRVEETRLEQVYENYGRIAYSQKANVNKGILLDWLLGGPVNLAQALENLERIGYRLTQDTLVYPVIAHVLRWQREPWSFARWSRTSEEILAELLGGGSRILSCGLDNTSVCFLIYGESIPLNHLLAKLHEMALLTNEEYGFEIAFYTMNAVEVRALGGRMEELRAARRNNVAKKPKVFLADQHRGGGPVVYCEEIRMKHWEALLTGGEAEAVVEEVRQYLNEVERQGNLNRETLQCFYLDFQQMLFNAAYKKRLRAHEAFGGESSLSAAAGDSLDDFFAYLRRAVRVFAQTDEDRSAPSDIVGRVAAYVEANLDKPLSVGEVAEGVYMNADYISRVFKQAKGVPLKEYIVEEKIRAARLLLRTTTLPVSAVASRVGYDNFSHFSQVYRRATGNSPSEERKNARPPGEGENT